MSFEASDQVWALDIFPPSKKLVLLSLAEHLNQQSGRLDPSVGRIAKRCSLSEKQARRYLHELEKDGLLQVTGFAAGGSKPRAYKLNLTAPPPLDGSPPIGVSPPIQGSPPLPPQGAHPSHPGKPTPPVDGSRISMNQNELELNKNLSPNKLTKPERDEDQDEGGEFKKVQQQLLSAGWLGRIDQARAIYEHAKTKTDGSLSHFLTPEMIAGCNSWPKSTSWLIKCLKSRTDKQTAQLPPGRNEVVRREITNGEQASTYAEQKQGRIDLQKAFLSLPAGQLAKLKEDYLKSSDSVIYRVAIERDGWDSKSGAIWGPFRGWLSKHHPNLLAQLTNKPVGSNVFPLPLPGVETSSAEEVDQEGLARVAEMVAKG